MIAMTMKSRKHFYVLPKKTQLSVGVVVDLLLCRAPIFRCRRLFDPVPTATLEMRSILTIILLTR